MKKYYEPYKQIGIQNIRKNIEVSLQVNGSHVLHQKKYGKLIVDSS